MKVRKSSDYNKIYELINKEMVITKDNFHLVLSKIRKTLTCQDLET